MKFHVIFVFLIFLFWQNAKSDTCEIENKSTAHYLGSLRDAMISSVHVSAECFEQEVTDVILDPYRIQSLALKLCAETTECVNFIVSEASRVSKKDESIFKGQSLVYVWSDIHKFAGFNRIRPPSIQDLPLSKNPEDLFEKLNKEKLKTSELSQSEKLKFTCSALAMIIGPGKLKALKAVGAISKTFKIQQSHEVIKLISKNKLPTQVKEKFLKWTAEVEAKGLEEVKKIPGYHDEPIKAFAGERRSVRLSDGFRACYESVLENGTMILKIITISQDHKNYCN